MIEISLPRFTCKLPLLQKEVEYRPFNVREEKVLLLATIEKNSEQTIQALDQIFNACTFGKYGIRDLPKLDSEFLFLKIRNKAMGEGMSANGVCVHCAGRTPMTLNMDNVKIVGDAKINPTVEIEEGKMWFKMRHPSAKDSLDAAKLDDVTDLDVIVPYISSVVVEDQVVDCSNYTKEEVKDFLGQFAKYQLEKLKPFFASYPKLVFEQKFTCKVCSKENHVYMDNLQDFFT